MESSFKSNAFSITDDEISQGSSNQPKAQLRNMRVREKSSSIKEPKVRLSQLFFIRFHLR